MTELRHHAGLERAQYPFRAVLYHGGAPGFEVGDVIEPHETKHFDDCPTCAARADENHRSDRVFATPVRIYGKYYASKWGRGTLYIVEPVGMCERSEADSIATFYAFSMRVVKVAERGVELTMTERRHLYRVWGEADRAAGFPDDPQADREMQHMLSMSQSEFARASRRTLAMNAVGAGAVRPHDVVDIQKSESPSA